MARSNRTRPWLWIPLLGGGALVFWVALAVSAAVIFPSIVFNKFTLERAGRLLRSSGVDVSWKAIEASAQSLSIASKRVKVEAGGFCFRSPGIEACARSVTLGAEISFARFLPRITVLGPLAVDGGKIKVDPAAFPPGDGKSPAGGEGIPELVKYARLAQVSIELSSVRVLLPAPERELRGAFTLRGDPSGAGVRWKGKLDATLRGGPWANRARVAIGALSPGGKWFEAPKGGLDLRAAFTDGRDLRADLVLSPVAGSLGFRLKGFYLDGRKYVGGDLKGDWGERGGNVAVQASARGFAPGLRRVSTRNCRISLLREGESRSRIRTDCGLDAWVRVPPVRDLPFLRLPTATRARLQADVTTSFPPSPDESIAGTVGVVVDPLLTPLLQSERSRVSTAIEGVPSRFPDGWKIDSAVDVRLRVAEFARAVELLAPTPWAVPAPFNTLRGAVWLESRGRAELGLGASAGGGSIPILFKARLASAPAADQRMDLDGKGSLRVMKRGAVSSEQAGRVEPLQGGARGDSSTELGARLELRVVLSEVQLALPRLDLERPPRLFPDSRVSSGRASRKEPEPEEPGASAFEYDIEVATPEGRPIRILSDRAKTLIPIGIHVRAASGEPVRGSVRVADFRLENFFRLKGAVEKLNLDFTTEEGASKGRVDGVFRVDVTEYEIHVGVTGPVEQPTYRFWSEPPLPEQQIFATLLFGRPIEELDPEQAQSAENLRQATAINRGLGLASFFLLSFTPVESIGYDRESGQVDVRVRIAQGTSLTLGGNVGGSGSAVTTVGLRRRLSRFWTLSTEVGGGATSSSSSSTTGTDEAQALSTYLEWSRRY